MSCKSRYLLETGTETTSSDQNRIIWFSALCGYWTDNWALLIIVGPGIPACPHCKCPGLQVVASTWDKGVKICNDANPGYHDFINNNKEHCFGRDGGFKKALEPFVNMPSK